MNKQLSLRYDDLSLKYYHDTIIEDFLEFFQNAFDFNVTRLDQLTSYIDVEQYLANNKLYMISFVTAARQAKQITVLEFYNMQYEVWKFADELAKFEGRLTSTPSEKRVLWRKIKKELKIKRNIAYITKNQYVKVLFHIHSERIFLDIKRKKTCYDNFPQFKKGGLV